MLSYVKKASLFGDDPLPGLCPWTLDPRTSCPAPYVEIMNTPLKTREYVQLR